MAHPTLTELEHAAEQAIGALRAAQEELAAADAAVVAAANELATLARTQPGDLDAAVANLAAARTARAAVVAKYEGD